jgi:hypothetical protein
VYEKRVWKKVFDPGGIEMIVAWRKLHNEDLCNLYFLQTNIRMITSGGMRGAGHVAYMGERDHLGDLDIVGG